MQLGVWCALKSHWSARTEENASSTKNQEPCQEGERQRKALYKWREIQSNLICQLFWREVLAFVCNSTRLLPALTSFKNEATERYFLLASQKWEEAAVLALSVRAVCPLWATHVCFLLWDAGGRGASSHRLKGPVDRPVSQQSAKGSQSLKL